jgi:hypothetical protein
MEDCANSVQHTLFTSHPGIKGKAQYPLDKSWNGVHALQWLLQNRNWDTCAAERSHQRTDNVKVLSRINAEESSGLAFAIGDFILANKMAPRSGIFCGTIQYIT